MQAEGTSIPALGFFFLYLQSHWAGKWRASCDRKQRVFNTIPQALPLPDAAAASAKMLRYCYSMMGAQHHPSSKRQEAYSFDVASLLSDSWISLSLSLSHSVRQDRQTIHLCHLISKTSVEREGNL